MLRDLRRFRHAPGFATSDAMHRVYPAVMTSLAERALVSSGRGLKQFPVTLLHEQ